MTPDERKRFAHEGVMGARHFKTSPHPHMSEAHAVWMTAYSEALLRFQRAERDAVDATLARFAEFDNVKREHDE